MNVYILFRHKPSPCFIFYPTVICVYDNKKEADAECLRLTKSKKTTFDYWVRSAKFSKAPAQQSEGQG